MSNIKSLISEDYDASEGHLDPFFYPGEEEAAMEALAKESMLDNFTIEELEAELDRRYTKKYDEIPIMAGTRKMLDDFVNLYTPNARDRNDEMPF